MSELSAFLFGFHGESFLKAGITAHTGEWCVE